MDSSTPVYHAPSGPSAVYHGAATNFAASRISVPDVDPMAATKKRLQGKATTAQAARPAVPRDYTGAKNPELLIQRVEQLERSLSLLETKVGDINSSLLDATIEAVCNEDSTISITLTFPDLPGAEDGGGEP